MEMVVNNAALQSNPNLSAIANVEIAKGMQEVQAMCVIAWQRPRDVNQCYLAVMRELERYSLARKSLYSYPRGGATVTGPSIRMIEMIARNFKNLKYGSKILTLANGVAECESFCWDVEANVYRSIPFTVKLVRDTKQGPKPLTDERDIYELIANYGARRVRSCIQSSIPADILEDAIEKAKETIEKGEKSLPLNQRVRNLVKAFEEFTVSKEMVEARYERGLDMITRDQFIELFGIFNSLKDKQGKVEDYFKFVTEDKTTPQDVTAAAVAHNLENNRLAVLANVEAKVKRMMDGAGRTGDTILRLENLIYASESQLKSLKLEQLVAMDKGLTEEVIANFISQTSE